MARWSIWIIGGSAIIASSFLATQFVLDSTENVTLKTGDDLRAERARLIMTALEKYRGAVGAYPVFPPPHDVPVIDLKNELVKGGYLGRLPDDPLWPDTPRYVSYDGKKYGLLFRRQFAKGNIAAGGQCFTGVGTAGNGWWGEPPNCAF